MLPPWHCQLLTPSQAFRLLDSHLAVSSTHLHLQWIEKDPKCVGCSCKPRFKDVGLCLHIVIWHFRMWWLLGYIYHQEQRHSRMQQGRPANPTHHLAQGVLAPFLTHVWKTCTKKLLTQVSLAHLVNLRELLLVLLCLRAALAWRLPIKSPPS